MIMNQKKFEKIQHDNVGGTTYGNVFKFPVFVVRIENWNLELG